MIRDPRRMTYDEIVQEIHGLKAEMERAVTRVVELSLALHSRVRQNQSDEYATRYLSFANTWTRFGQMVEASLQRTGSVSRLVKTIAADKQAAADDGERQQRQEARRAKKSAPRQQTTPDLVELYGEEMVTNAAR